MKRTLNFLFVIMSATLLNAQTLTDWHCHNVTADFLAALERHDALMDENFPMPQWSAEEHLAFMDEAGIKTSVLSMPAPQPWWGDGTESQRICRLYNEQTAALCRRHEGRFQFVAALPLPDVELAIEEAEFALKNLGAESVAKEPGVICIYPMIQKRDSTQIRILEIYRDQAAYQNHIQTAHFQTYKQGTLHMVKSLDLIDMRPMNPVGMWEIFRKME